MAWYSDEEYVFRKDCGEKKSVAASSHKQRTHCGKGGRVKFPSDFMTKKEREAMNGECVSYKLGKPMSLTAWRALPEEFQKEYIVNIREKFNTPDSAIAEMMGCSRKILGLYLTDLKLNHNEHKAIWDEEGFKKWAYPAEVVKEEINETVVEPEVELIDISIKPISWEAFKTLTDEEKIKYVKTIRETFGASDTAISKLFAVSQAHFSHVMRKLGIAVGVNNGPKKNKWDQERFERWAYPHRFMYTFETSKPEPVEKTPVVEPCEPVCEAVEAPVSEEEAVVDIPVVEETAVSEVVVETVEIDEMCEEHDEPAEIKFDILQTPTGMCVGRIAEPVSLYAVPNSGSMTFECEANRALATLSTLLGNTNIKLKIEWEVV